MSIGLDSQVRRAQRALAARPGLLVLSALLPLFAGLLALPLIACPGYSSLVAGVAPRISIVFALFGIFSWLCTAVGLGICVAWWSEAVRAAITGAPGGLAAGLGDGLSRVGRYVMVTAAMLLCLFLLTALPWLGMSAAGRATVESASPLALPATLSLPLFAVWGLALVAFIWLTSAWPMAAALGGAAWLRPLGHSQAMVRRHWPTFLGIAGAWALATAGLVAVALAFHIPAAIGGLASGSPYTSTAGHVTAGLALLTLWLASAYVNALASVTGFVAYADGLGIPTHG